MNPEFHDTTGEQAALEPHEMIRSYVEILACQIVGSPDMITFSGSYPVGGGAHLVALIQDLDVPFKAEGIDVFPATLYSLSVYDKTSTERESLTVSSGTDGIIAHTQGEHSRDLSGNESKYARDAAINSFMQRYDIEKLVAKNTPPVTPSN